MKIKDKVFVEGLFNGIGIGEVVSLYFAQNVKTGKKEKVAKLKIGNITFHKPVKEIS